MCAPGEGASALSFGLHFSHRAALHTRTVVIIHTDLWCGSKPVVDHCIHLLIKQDGFKYKFNWLVYNMRCVCVCLHFFVGTNSPYGDEEFFPISLKTQNVVLVSEFSLG